MILITRCNADAILQNLTQSLEDGQSDVNVEDVVEEPPKPPAVMPEMRGARAAFGSLDDVELETTVAQLEISVLFNTR